jgi:hypothetical protein
MEGIEDYDQQSHTEQMRLLLRPRPLPGVENFGIPPDPEGEVNPDVQVRSILDVITPKWACSIATTVKNWAATGLFLARQEEL